MGYVVFALKWRPQSFNEIVGQAHIVTKLKAALEKERVANAYLFTGPRGVGKTSTARILAKALNCKEGLTANPCGKCTSCLQITQGRSLDVIEIDGASNRGIDEIRTLRENVKFAAVSARFKIYIIDEVHMLTTDAFNALLKTLEEPPEFVKFIFATTQPHKVIPTVLSRCQRFDFRRIPVLEIIAQLEKIAGQEKAKVSKEVLFAIAKSSDGSLRDAESVLDQLVAFAKNEVSLEDIVSLFGLVEQEALFAIADTIIVKDTEKALNLLNTVIEEGKDTSVFLTNLIEHFRNLMIAKITQADAKLIDLPQDICDRLLEQSGSFSLGEIFSVFNILVNTHEMSRRLDSLRIPLEIALVKLTHIKKDPPAQNILQKQPQENKVEPVENNPGVSLENIKDSWQDIITAVGRVKMSLATFMHEASPIRLANNILTVSFPKNCSLHKESVERKENRLIIEKVLSELFNATLRASFILSQEASREESGDETPFIKSVLETFKGRVIKE